MRETSDALTGLVKLIDQKLESAGKSQRAMGAYVLFDSNAPGLESALRTMAEKQGIKRVNLCIGAAPPDYAISKEAEVTVVIYNPNRRGDQKVTANFALRSGELDCEITHDIVTALAKVLPK